MLALENTVLNAWWTTGILGGDMGTCIYFLAVLEYSYGLQRRAVDCLQVRNPATVSVMTALQVASSAAYPASAFATAKIP